MLTKKHIMASGWATTAPVDQTEGTDFVTSLLDAYLEDIRVRNKEDEFGDVPASILLRKRVKLNSIDEIIDELAARTTGLKSDAEAYEERLAEEARLKDIA
jgi:hypothetical protein